VPLDLGDLTDNRAHRAGRTQMELSCPHDRPRRRHRGPAGGGIEEGPQGEKLAGGSTEARIRLFCLRRRSLSGNPPLASVGGFMAGRT
jgi:hypothetical protein